jgi:hypothetical protein
MEIDVAERARLECEFAEQIGTVVDQLVSSEFSEEETLAFVSSVKTFLKFEDLKDYIIDVLLVKTKTVANDPFENHRLDKEYKSFRKLIRVIISIGEEHLIETLATFLLKDNNSIYYFILLEEMVKKKCDTKSVENIFLSLISTMVYDLDRVNKFLDIIGKNSSYLVPLLLNDKRYLGLKRYISLLSAEELKNIVIPLIIENYQGTQEKYFSIVLEALIISEKIIYPLLFDCPKIGQCESAFAQFLIENSSFNIPPLKKYLEYLSQYNPSAIVDFENKLLQTDKAYLINQYALMLPLVSKRKIMTLLIKLKQEPILVEFIKKYPEFEPLLPML